MKPPARIRVHIVDANCLIQRQQNVSDTLNVSAGNPSRIVILEQPFESTTSKGNNSHRAWISIGCMNNRLFDIYVKQLSIAGRPYRICTEPSDPSRII